MSLRFVVSVHRRLSSSYNRSYVCEQLSHNSPEYPPTPTDTLTNIANAIINNPHSSRESFAITLQPCILPVDYHVPSMHKPQSDLSSYRSTLESEFSECKNQVCVRIMDTLPLYLIPLSLLENIRVTMRQRVITSLQHHGRSQFYYQLHRSRYRKTLFTSRVYQ